MASMLPFAVLALVAALAILAARVLIAHARQRGLEGEVARLSGLVRELAGRLEAAEDEAGRAFAAAEVAGRVLVEKGVADEEELEAARARSGIPVAPRHVPGRDGEVH
jgi:hypothetical protein